MYIPLQIISQGRFGLHFRFVALHESMPMHSMPPLNCAEMCVVYKLKMMKRWNIGVML